MYKEVLLSLALNYQHIIFQLISWEVILGQSPESMAVDVKCEPPLNRWR